MGCHYLATRTEDAVTKIFSQRLHSCSPSLATQSQHCSLNKYTNDVFCCRCHRKKKSPRRRCGITLTLVHGVCVGSTTGLILSSLHPHRFERRRVHQQKSWQRKKCEFVVVGVVKFISETCSGPPTPPKVWNLRRPDRWYLD